MTRKFLNVLISYDKDRSLLIDPSSHRTTAFRSHLSRHCSWYLESSRENQCFTKESALRITILNNFAGLIWEPNSSFYSF